MQRKTEENNKMGKTRDLFKNFPQLVVIYTIKGFSVINEAEVDFFWHSRAFPMIQQTLAI